MGASPVESVATSLRRRAGERRVVLAIDDAHLLDDGAAAIIHYLATTGQAWLVMTARAREPWPEVLTALWKDGQVERIELTALSEGEVSQLVAAALGGPLAHQAASRLWHLSEGNPLMLLEIVQQSLEQDAFRFSGVLWHWTGLATTGPRLHDLVAEHLRRIDDPSREVLRLVSFGQPLRGEVLQMLASKDQVSALVAGELVASEETERGRAYRVSHPLYGEFMRDQTGAAEARSVMGKLAEATLAVGGLDRDDQLRLARWWIDTGHPGQPEILAAAAGHALDVGQAGAATEFARAALAHGDHFGAALSLAEASRSSTNPEGLWTLLEAARRLAGDEQELTRWAIASLQATRRDRPIPSAACAWPTRPSPPSATRRCRISCEGSWP
jgi:hypothetical protein